MGDWYKKAMKRADERQATITKEASTGDWYKKAMEKANERQAARVKEAKEFSKSYVKEDEEETKPKVSQPNTTQNHKVTRDTTSRRTTSDKRVQLGTLEERKGEQAERQDRTWNAIKGTGKQIIGSNASTVGTAMSATDNMALGIRKKGVSKDDARLKDVISAAGIENPGKQVTSWADKKIQSGAEDIETAKEGMSDVGKFAVDVGSQALMIGADALMNTIAPGLGTASFAARAGGMGAYEARQDGATEEEQMLYGSVIALEEMALEKLFSAGKYMRSLYGKGAMDLATDAASKVATSNLVKGITKTPQGRELVYQLTKLGVGATEEGIEEALADLISPLLQRAVYADEIDMPTFKEVAYDFLLGAASGGMFAGAGTVADYKSGVGRMNQVQTAQQDGRDITQEMIDRASVQGEGTAAQEFGQKLSAQRQSGKEVLGGQLNDLQGMTQQEQLKHETEFRRQKDEQDRVRMAGDVDKFKSNGSATERRAMIEISSSMTKDRMVDIENKIAENGDLSLDISGDSATIEAVAKVAIGTATTEDIDRILTKPAAKTLVKEVTGMTVPVENGEARKALENLVVFTGAEIRAEIQQKAKAKVAEDMSRSLGRHGSSTFVNLYQNVADVDNEKFNTIFNRFYDAGTYSMPIEAVSKTVDDIGGSYQAIVDKYFTPEARMAIYKAGKADSAVETTKNEQSVIRHEKVSQRSRKGAFRNDSSGEVSKTLEKALTTFAKRTGTQVVYVDTLGESNGAYINGTIYLAKDADNPLITVAKHELTHHLKKFAPKEYKELEDFVFSKWYNSDPEAYEAAIQKKLRQYAGTSDSFTREDAKEEILADAAEAFFTDESAIDSAIAYSKKLGEAILDGIRAVLDTFRVIADADENKRYRGYGEFMKELGILEEAERKWMKALQASMKNDVKAEADGDVDNDIDIDIDKYSIKEGMTDEERYEELKNKKIRVVATNDVDIPNSYDLREKNIGAISKFVRNNKEALGLHKKYKNNEIEVEFSYSSRGIKKSIATTADKNIDIREYFDLISCLDEVIESAVLVERHSDKMTDGPSRLKQVYVMLGAYSNKNNDIVPVQLEIKEYTDNENQLYLAVTIKKSSVDITPTANAEAVTLLDNISITELVKKINPNEVGFLKYFPEQFLSSEQKEGKKIGIEKDIEKYPNSPYRKFSLKEPVEETKDLIAVHNMQSSELMKTLNLGGFPMPSIAVIKAKAGHNEYGDVSVVFDKDTIDPELMKANKVYGGDAWTPTYPKIEYKANEKADERISTRLGEILYEIPEDFRRGARKLMNEAEDLLNHHEGEAGMIKWYANDYDMKQAFLTEKGQAVPLKHERTETELSPAYRELYDGLIDKVPEAIEKAYGPGRQWNERYGEEFKEAYKQWYVEQGIPEDHAQSLMEAQPAFYWVGEARKAAKYRNEGPITVSEKVDYEATWEEINEKTDQKEYEAWLKDLLSGLEEKRGIRNNADPFTRSGNRRSWEALHWEETLENVVRIMKEEENGTGFFGGSGIFGVSATDYGSIAELKADSSRLDTIPQEEYQQIKDEIGQRFQDIATSIMSKSMDNEFIAIDNAMECMVDAVRKSKTKSGIMKELKKYKHLTVTEQNVDDLVRVVQDIAAMPTGYFEAKPQRAVGLDEIKAILLPNDADSELLSRLQNDGYNVIQYEANNAEDRVEKLNSIEDVRFQLKSGESYDRKVKSLEERVAHLKSEMKKTGLKTPVEKDVKVRASKLLKKYDSSIVLHTDLVDTMKNIFKIYKTEDGNWAEAYMMAEEMAHRIVDKISILHDESYQEYKELRKHLKTVPVAVSEADKASMTDYKAFHKANFGRILLTNDRGFSVDKYYQSLMENWPTKFTDDYTNAADQLYHIEDVLNSLAPWYETYDSDQMYELVMEIAEDIMVTTEMLATRKTFADKKAEEKERAVARVKKQRDEAMERMKDRYEEKLIRQKKVSKDRMDAYKEKQKDRASRKKAMDRIETNYNWLRERLLTPSDTKHIPESYRKAVAELLEGFDFETKKTDKYEAKHGTSKRVIQLRVFKDRFRQVMDAQKGEEFIEIDPNFMVYMDEITDAIDGKRLSELDTSTLDHVSKLLKILRHQVAYINQCFNDDIREGIQELGEATINEANSQKEAKEYSSVKLQLNNLLNKLNVTPADMFEVIGGTQKMLYQAMRNGFDRHVQNVQMAIQFTQDTVGKTKVKEWSQQTHTFNLKSGKVEMTTAQLMSLYALSQRLQAQGHVFGGGIMIAPVEVKAGKLKVAKEKLKKTHVKPTLEEVLEMVGTLTEEQRRIADELRNFLSNECSEWGNRTSMKLYGYKKFGEKYYFPIKSSEEYLVDRFDQTDVETSLRNMGFTKSPKEGAKNTIVIDDFFTVFTEHVTKMSMYEALVPAMADYTRVYNYKQSEDDDSVKEALGRAYGEKTKDYIKRFMEDVNGSQRVRNDAEISTALISTYKKASIGGNLRVLLQQPTSLVRAWAVINPKYFTNRPATKKDIEEMMAHCPIAQWKSYGFYNTDVARDMKDIMLGEKNAMDKIFMESYGKTDDWTWANIWKAVKKEVEDKHKDLKVGSDEYWQKVNERASYVFDRTQVVDSVFHRSQIMRNKGVFEKMLTSFMAEPTKTYNLLRTEIITAKRELTAGDKKAAAGRVSRVLSVYLLNAMTVSMAAAIADSMRGVGGDDEEDQGKFGQRWWKHSIANFKDNANPLNLLPYAKDIVSMYSGYDIERMDMQGISKLLKIQSMWEGIADGSSKYTTGHVIRTTAETLSYFTGIPIKNVLRDVEGTAKTVAEMFGNGTAVKYQTAKWTYRLSEESNNRLTFLHLYYEAQAEGDKALANEIYRYMRSQGVTEEYINSKTRRKNWETKQKK